MESMYTYRSIVTKKQSNDFTTTHNRSGHHADKTPPGFVAASGAIRKSQTAKD
jgi:hypothetical protein